MAKIKAPVTKYGQVKKHLYAKHHITSLQAIELYGATRLSAIIFMLKKELKKEGKFIIKTIPKVEKDRNGNNCTFAKYCLIPAPAL